MTDPNLPEDPYDFGEAELRHAMELLFFAYRDFTAGPDAVLADYGFGRAHHRTLYFIGRHSGISVSELLAILRVTKQSLARVLGQLVDEGFVAQEADAQDRRRRNLSLTEKGADLEHRLTDGQMRHVLEAYRVAGGDAADGFKAVLKAMIAPADRAHFAKRPSD